MIHFQQIQTEDGACITVSGDLTARHISEFASTVHKAAYGGRTVALDLSGLRFVDSSGLGTIFGLHHQLGDKLKIRRTSPALEKLLSHFRSSVRCG